MLQQSSSIARHSTRELFGCPRSPRMVECAGVEAKLGFKAHPHMLRHACGYALANKGERHAIVASLPRPEEYPAYGPLHGHGADAV